MKRWITRRTAQRCDRPRRQRSHVIDLFQLSDGVGSGQDLEHKRRERPVGAWLIDPAWAIAYRHDENAIER